jgi:Caspase domain/Domain of unknown function (DUF4384)
MHTTHYTTTARQAPGPLAARFKAWSLHAAAALCAISALSTTQLGYAQSTSSARATELRADKLATANVISAVPAGSNLRLVSLEGGWAYVEHAGKLGWVRASALNLQAGTSSVSGTDTGRQATGGTINAALTLGVRSLPPRINRHALIIGVSQYADKDTPPLPGARVDRESATQMAGAMQVPSSNITYLQDSQATGDNIRKALGDLNARVQDGDRVFVHYSGHGTRYNDPAAGGCIEALLAYDGGQRGTITNREMSEMLKPITAKTDKLFVMYDACHSGGLVANAAPARTRGFTNPDDEGTLRPKFASITEECGRPVNVKTRNLLVEQVKVGALPQDVIHISASKDNEISFDDSNKGGLATQFMRDCMLRDAKDTDGSGAISMDEIRQCAQTKIDQRMKNDANFKAHNIQLSGNTGFVPAWFSQAAPIATVASLAPVVVPTPAATQTPAPVPAPVVVAPIAPPKPVAAAPTAPPKPVATAPTTGQVPVAAAPVISPPAPAVVVAPATAQLSGEQALRQMFDQRDAKRNVRVVLGKDKLKIGQDSLDFMVQSDRAGYVYVAMAGSDNKSMYLLFPNDLDQSNKIEAGQQLTLPRPNWRVKAGGPEGRDNLLIFVADSPRDLSSLAASKAGPFVSSLNNSQGRASLGALMSTSNTVTSQECTSAATRRNNPLCSDAYGAAMVAVDEVK